MTVHSSGAAVKPAEKKFTENQERLLKHLVLRSLELADRVASGELQFLDAVDVAFDAAEASGLAASVGYDVVQDVLARAFRGVRP
jgi:hypothetical protein